MGRGGSRRRTSLAEPPPLSEPASEPVSDRTPIFGLLPEDLCRHLEAHGVRAELSDARRILSFAVSHGRRDWRAMRHLRREVRAVLEATIALDRPEVVERVEDPADGFVKYLLRAPDGALSEAVRIPLHKPGRYSVCLSSQVGCAMQCVFCATGRLGLSRHLSAAEMVAAWRTVQDDTREDTQEDTPDGPVGSAVFMGQGEPFHNYDAVIRAAQILSHPNGGRIAQRSITISTVGLVPQIRRFTQEGHKFRLFVSLTSADEDQRRALLPVAGRFALEDLADALRAHHRATGHPITLAWVVLGGVNAAPADAERIRAFLPDVPVIVNLIDVNDARPDGFRRATGPELEGFRDALAAAGLAFRRRYSGGQAKHAACGMLASSVASRGA